MSVASRKLFQVYSPFLHGRQGLLSQFLKQISKQSRNRHLSSKSTNMADGHSTEEKPDEQIKQVNGDLFTCPETHSLAHCISADVKMGKGIAVRFKQLYGGVDDLLSQRQRPGGLAVLEKGQRYIYYLVTKEKYWQKPTYETLRASLEKMKQHNLKYGVKHVCMPKIGCGLDRLEWPEVLGTINYVYQDTDIKITVYHFEDPNARGQKQHYQQRAVSQRQPHTSYRGSTHRGQHGRWHEDASHSQKGHGRGYNHDNSNRERPHFPGKSRGGRSSQKEFYKGRTLDDFPPLSAKTDKQRDPHSHHNKDSKRSTSKNEIRDQHRGEKGSGDFAEGESRDQCSSDDKRERDASNSDNQSEQERKDRQPCQSRDDDNDAKRHDDDYPPLPTKMDGQRAPHSCHNKDSKRSTSKNETRDQHRGEKGSSDHGERESRDHRGKKPHRQRKSHDHRGEKESNDTGEKESRHHRGRDQRDHGEKESGDFAEGESHDQCSRDNKRERDASNSDDQSEQESKDRQPCQSRDDDNDAKRHDGEDDLAQSANQITTNSSSKMATPEWDYSQEKGPNNWYKHYPSASGNHQSPIDIVTAETQYDSSLLTNPMSIQYSPANDFQVVNNGRSVTISRKGDVTGHQLSGGPLEHNYRFAQFHFHWGSDSTVGSEHLVDGKAFPGELHLVHWNVDLFQSFGEAATSRNGLAVLGFFIEVGDSVNPGLETISDFLPQVHNTGEQKDLNSTFNMASILAANTKDYWTYNGSLTTPPCAESVTWFVFKTPIYATEEQMKQFRALKANDKEEIVNNYRPVLPLNGRLVKASFQ